MWSRLPYGGWGDVRVNINMQKVNAVTFLTCHKYSLGRLLEPDDPDRVRRSRRKALYLSTTLTMRQCCTSNERSTGIKTSEIWI